MRLRTVARAPDLVNGTRRSMGYASGGCRNPEDRRDLLHRRTLPVVHLDASASEEALVPLARLRGDHRDADEPVLEPGGLVRWDPGTEHGRRRVEDPLRLLARAGSRGELEIVGEGFVAIDALLDRHDRRGHERVVEVVLQAAEDELGHGEALA